MSIAALSLAAVPELKRILLATDLSLSAESLAALPYVRGIADTFGSSVFLWHALASNGEEPIATPMEMRHIEKQASEKLAGLSHTVQLQSLPVKALVTSGSVAAELPKAIAEHDISLVVARTSGRRGLQRILYGSVVDEICRVASCPVLTVGPYLLPRREIRFKRIIVPTDLSFHSQRVLPIAVALATRYGASVTVLHVLPEGWEERPDQITVREAARRAMSNSFDRPLSNVDAELICETGEPVEMILRVARQKSADLIAMGVNNAFEPGIQMCPSVASRVVSEAHCPVLTSH
ncbi:MAG TPA: universal stress protein [Candidatus Acidoferrales bacterium]|jgi:nucleotide-binding universal stress UspA family protein|nr:universal stress protein [Candidatus Acidoferrales bacterium]